MAHRMISVSIDQMNCCACIKQILSLSPSPPQCSEDKTNLILKLMLPVLLKQTNTIDGFT